MTIQEMKKELGLNNEQIAEFFGYKNSLSYRNSSAKSRIESGLCSFYAFVKSKGGGENIKTDVSNRRELFDKFYEWLDGLSQTEYDDMSLTDKCEKFFFKT